MRQLLKQHSSLVLLKSSSSLRHALMSGKITFSLFSAQLHDFSIFQWQLGQLTSSQRRPLSSINTGTSLIWIAHLWRNDAVDLEIVKFYLGHCWFATFERRWHRSQELRGANSSGNGRWQGFERSPQITEKGGQEKGQGSECSWKKPGSCLLARSQEKGHQFWRVGQAEVRAVGCQIQQPTSSCITRVAETQASDRGHWGRGWEQPAKEEKENRWRRGWTFLWEEETNQMGWKG